MPIQSSKKHDPAGVLVVGLSSRLQFGSFYRHFLELVAAQLGTAIANARAYEEERKRAEALAAIDRAKTLFFSNVSHEFRTPLTLMLGPLEDMFAKAEALPVQQREQLELAHRNSLRLLKLVNSLLDFSRIEAGRAQPQFKQTDLSVFTCELASVFRSAMEKAGLKYVVDCPPLPRRVFIDRGMWEKIVFNLLSNSLKFTLSGEVHVSLSAEDGMAVLTVHDTGSGIPSWELPNIFKRFHRVENTRGRTHEGTGIGLALAQELVKLHGGATEVESELGAYTIIRVRIPFGEKHLAAQTLASGTPQVSTALRGETFVAEALTWLPQEAQESARKEWEEQKEMGGCLASGGARPRILLAEDNADMRDYLCRLMNPLYQIEAVSNGAAALAAARNHAPDLILSDIMMPEMDGLELVRALREDKSLNSIPIVLLSARTGEEAKVEGVSRGADDYLIKPFSARELLARIATHLQLARVRKESIEALQLSRLSGHLLQAQDAERRRLARELHDGAGQILVVLAMNANRMSKEAKKNAPLLAETAAETEQLIERLNREIRTTSYLLHPPLLDENGLAEALKWYIRGLRECSGLNVVLSVSDNFERFPNELELAIFRLVQESLTNVHRHSRSEKAMVRIVRDADHIVVEVEDEGKGIAPEKLAEIQTQGSGVGIQGMRERVRHFHGEMKIESNSRGTKIVARFPAARIAPVGTDQKMRRMQTAG